MKMLKGCLNPSCELSERKSKKKEVGEVNKLKKTFKHNDNFCIKCGMELNYVCKVCNNYLPDDSAKTCERCIAESEDRKAENNKNAKKIAGGIGGLAFAIPVIKETAKVVKNIVLKK